MFRNKNVNIEITILSKEVQTILGKFFVEQQPQNFLE